MRTILTFFWAFSSSGLCCQPAPAPASAAFEVASIKIARNSGSAPGCEFPCGGERLTVTGNRVDIRFMSLHQLIVRAYRIKLYQLAGPKWMTSQKFDIMAKMPDNVSKDQIPEMLQRLLSERFSLALHRESKVQPVYALVVGKNGPRATTARNAAFVPDATGEQTLHTPYGEGHRGKDGAWQIREGPHGPIRIHKGFNPTTGIEFSMEFFRVTMPELSEALTPSVDRVVVDATGLKGDYQVKLVWSVPPPSPRAAGDGNAPSPAPPPALSFVSIEKAGLKLERRTAPVEMIAVDRLERTPSGN